MCKDIAQVKQVLQIIAADPDVKILRWKNRFDPTYNSSLSAGYRDFAMNLKFERVPMGESLPHGVSEADFVSVIFEVQLQLEVIHACKKEEGHRNYVRFRNTRAQWASTRNWNERENDKF